MSTKFLSPGWRMPRNANQSKISNYSIDFDGSSQYIDLNTSLNGINSITYSVWIKPEQPSGNYGYIITAGDYGLTDRMLSLGVSSGQYSSGPAARELFVFGGQGAGGLNVGRLNYYVTYGTWYHIAIVYTNNQDVDLYVNGNSEGSIQFSDTSSIASGSPTRIGAYSGTLSNYFKGQIDAVSIFNYALSSSQITTLWGGGTSVSNPMALPSPPIAYYPLGTSAWDGNFLAENNAIGDYVFDFVNTNSNYIQIPSSTDFVFGTGDFTISAWVNLDSSSSYSWILGSDSAGIVDGVTFGFDSSRNLQLWVAGVQTATSFSINLNQWHHVLATRNSGTVTFYIDGSAFGTTYSRTGSVPASSYNIGRLSNGVNYIDGSISNVQIFNTSLSGSDVETLYNNGSPIRTLANIPKNSNLKAWYKFDASEVYNNTSTEWSIDNNVFPTSYKSSLSFDGNNDVIDIPNSSVFDLGTSFTISGWFNVTSYVANMGYISFDSSTRGWFLFHQGTNLAIYDGTSVITLNSNLQPTNQWNSYIITYDGTDLIFYLNGQQNSTQAVSINLQTNGNDGQIGNQQFQAGRFYSGYISNVAIYNTALSASNVATLYNNGTPQATIYGSPVAHWKLDNTTTGIQDSAGSNNGTNNGATEYAGFVNVLAGNSSGMTQANLVQSDLQTVAPYSKYAMNFDGTDDYITLGSGNYGFPSLTTAGQTLDNFSISCWFKWEGGTISGSKTMLTWWKSGGVNPSFPYLDGFLQLTTGNAVRFGDDWVSAYTFSSLPTGWHHIVAVKTTDNAYVYVDGSLVGTKGSSLSFGFNRELRIGGFQGSGEYWDGALSNISLWNAALTVSQVSEIYNEGLPGNLNSHSAYSNLVSWWQLGENSSFDGNDWIVADEKGTNNGTSTGMPVGALVNGVGTTANGVSSGMGVGALVGNAPYSTANAISVDMSVTAKGTNVP